MTLKERLGQLAKDGLPIVRYGEGMISHVCLINAGVPILMECWLTKDCRESGVVADDIDHVIRCIPFKDRRTLDMFKDSINRIEQLLNSIDDGKK